jgi:chemotaxis protein histidine kinase CheA
MLGQVPARVPELSVVIVEAGATKYGRVVDRFLTEVEVLVKPLSNALEQCKEFQGAAIMGDGRVVLVLNALERHRLLVQTVPREGQAPIRRSTQTHASNRQFWPGRTFPLFCAPIKTRSRTR